MSESQSRYSIVERLTTKKLELMDTKANIDAEILQADKEYALHKANATIDKDNINNEAKRRCDAVDRREQELKNALDILKSSKDAQVSTVTQKLAAIDAALKNIEDISKNSPA